MMDVETAELGGIIIQSGLYGMYLTSSVVSVYCTYYIRGRQISPNKVVTSISFVLFLVITLFFTLSIVRSHHAFVGHRGSPAERVLVFLQLDAVQVARLTAYTLVMPLMDGLMIYRLYIIYLRDIRIILLPATSLLGFIVITIYQLGLCTRQATEKGFGEATSNFGMLAALNMGLSVFACTYTTFFIIFRILREGRAFKHFGIQNQLSPVLYIITESALLYTSLILIMLGFYLKNNAGAVFMLAHIIPPLIGFNFSVILIRIGLGIADVPQLGIMPPTIEERTVSQAPVTPEESQEHAIPVAVKSPEECSLFERCEI